MCYSRIFVDSTSPQCISDIEELLHKVSTGKASRNDMTQCDLLQTISSKTESQKKELRRTFATAQFWIQYADYIDAVKLFNTAEKKSHSDQNLHLSAVEKNDGLICSY